MKIQIFVRSAEWLNTAGTRIRYKRLQQELARLGVLLSIDPFSAIREGLRLNAEVYLFSKCHDAGALMVADMLREAGALVGFDLFDDYVSSSGSTTVGQRAFQRALKGHADFLLCSTARMAEVVRSFDAIVPVHVLNDPFAAFDDEALTKLLDAKVEAVRTTGRLDLLWFGVGSNPVYPVGLNDLTGFWEALKPLFASGLDVRLKVLTNGEAINGAGLRRLRNLPVPLEIEEWSVAGERAALDRAFAAFLPVNFQNFSIAKSLNRAVTALTHGTQVLWAGHRLYEKLDRFIYDDAQRLLADLATASLRLRRASVEPLRQCLADLAHPAMEAERFLRFLSELPPGDYVAVEQRQLRAIIHGAESTPAVHYICRTLGWLSLGSPLTRQKLPFDAHIGYFDGSETLELRLSRAALQRLDVDWIQLAEPLGKLAKEDLTHRLPIDATAGWPNLAALSPRQLATRAGRMVHAGRVMAATQAVYSQIFGAMTTMRSELEMPLPVIDQMIAMQGLSRQ